MEIQTENFPQKKCSLVSYFRKAPKNFSLNLGNLDKVEKSRTDIRLFRQTDKNTNKHFINELFSSYYFRHYNNFVAL